MSSQETNSNISIITIEENPTNEPISTPYPTNQPTMHNAQTYQAQPPPQQGPSQGAGFYGVQGEQAKRDGETSYSSTVAVNCDCECPKLNQHQKFAITSFFVWFIALVAFVLLYVAVDPETKWWCRFNYKKLKIDAFDLYMEMFGAAKGIWILMAVGLCSSIIAIVGASVDTCEHGKSIAYPLAILSIVSSIVGFGWACDLPRDCRAAYETAVMKSLVVAYKKLNNINNRDDIYTDRAVHSGYKDF